MNIVELTYNPYLCKTRIVINGSSVSPYGELAKFLGEPFQMWADSLLDAVARELNDDFSLLFASRPFEGRLLKVMAEQCSGCIDYRWVPLPVDTPLMQRLQELVEHASALRHTVEEHRAYVQLVAPEPCRQVWEAALSAHPRVNRIREDRYLIDARAILSIELDLREDATQGKDLDVFAFESAYHARTEWPPRQTSKHLQFFASLAEQSMFLGISGKTLLFQYEENRAVDDLIEWCDYAFRTDYLREIATGMEAKTDDVDASAGLSMVLNTEATIRVTCPEIVEVGSSVPIAVRVHSNDENEIPELIFECSQQIISCDGKRVYAYKTGEAFIDVFLKGSIEPIARLRMRCIQRNRIQEIKLNPTKTRMGENDRLSLEVSFAPEDADNAQCIEWISTNTDVATVSKKGVVRAKSAGSCKILAQCEGVEASCSLQVLPYIDTLSLPQNALRLRIGSNIPFQFAQEPRRTMNEHYYWEIDNTNVLQYDGNTLSAIGVGNAQIRVWTEKKGASDSCNVEVVSTMYKKQKLNMPKVLSLLAFLVSFAFYFSNPSVLIFSAVAAFGLSLGSLWLDIQNAKERVTFTDKPQKPQTNASILLLILSVAMIILAFRGT